jgi:hypothetical protein
MDAPEELLLLAAAQDGLITRKQAHEYGMTPASIRHALGRGGRWQRLAVGVYATFTGPLSLRHRIRAALLYAGPAATVTGGYACRAYGLRYVPDQSPLTALVPWSEQPAELAGARWTAAGLARRAVDDVRGCRSAPERELRDLIASSSLIEEPVWNQPLGRIGRRPLVPGAAWHDARVVDAAAGWQSCRSNNSKWHPGGTATPLRSRRWPVGVRRRGC